MATINKMIYMIIVGAGRVGERVIELAIKDGHEVVVVEKDQERAERISSDYDCLVIQGDASKLEVLKEAGIEKADALVATTSDDPANLLLMMLGRELEVPRLLSSVRNSDHISLFEELEVNFVESPHRINGEYLYRKIQRPGISDFMQLEGGAEILEIELPEESSLVGQSISDSREADKIPLDVNIIAIFREDELIIPRGKTKFEAGDIVTILSKEELSEETLKQFKPD